MKNASPLLLFFICLQFLSCNVNSDDDECGLVDCAGILVLAFDIQQDMENVFANGTFSLADVQFSGPIASDLIVETETLSSGESDGIIFVSNNNWMEGTSSFTIDFPDSQRIIVEVELENSAGPCCGGIPLLQSASVNGVTQELNRTLFTITLIPN